MPEQSPWPNRDGYVHREVAARQERQEYEATLAGLAIPMRRHEFVDQCSRDVSAPTDEPQAKVWVDRNGFVFIRSDERTASAGIYAVQLMAAEYEGIARDSFRLSETYPVDSYSRRNRIDIALRRERVASRLRVLETAYRDVITKHWHGM